MATKTRSDLKSYFVKNAIPTEGNFADLIDSQLNQAQDGVFKPDGDALTVVAATGDQKRVLRLYASYPAANPDWMISLNPVQDPTIAGSTGKPGFGITDGTGKTRLFVDAATGQIGVGTNTPQVALDVTGTVQATGLRANGALMIRRDASGQLGPTLTLQNNSGGAGTGGAIDFNNYDPGSNNPSLRIQSLDDGNFSSHLTFSTKQPGSGTNTLAERLRLTNDGLLKFPNVAPKDKIILWDNGTTDRFGIGLNASNINLFYPTNARFSLRQNSSSGTEVFSVSGDGAATLRRDVYGQLGPRLTLLNGGGDGGGGCAIDFNSYDPGSNDPALRIQTNDVGGWANFCKFMFKRNGAITNKLVERLRVEDNGQLTIYFDKGYWRFQYDGNLVKYRNDGTVLWSLSTNPGW